MDRKRIIAVTLAAAFAFTASVASADPRNHRGHRDGHSQSAKPHGDNRHGHARQHVRPGHAKRQPVVVHHHHYRPAPVARPVHWHQHRLAPPPPHYHWVQVGADYLLVAIASGIVAHAVLGH